MNNELPETDSAQSSVGFSYYHHISSHLRDLVVLLPLGIFTCRQHPGTLSIIHSAERAEESFTWTDNIDDCLV